MEVIFINSKINEFILSMETLTEQRIIRGLDLLSKEGYQLRLPFSRSLGDGLFELRIVGITHIRFIYVFHNHTIIILHVFVKKTDAISYRDLDYPRKLKNQLN